MPTDIKILESGIMERLPQVPFIVDQVGAAMQWAREEYDEGAYYKNIEFTSKVSEYASKVSERNFYKTHLVIAALLIDIENPLENPKFEIFKSASNSVANSLKAVRINPDLSENLGAFKAVSMHVVNLAKENQDWLAVYMLSILEELKDIVRGMEDAKVKAPITAEDYIKILGYQFVLQNLRLSKVSLYNTSSEIVNEISILLNEINF